MSFHMFWGEFAGLRQRPRRRRRGWCPRQRRQWRLHARRRPRCSSCRTRSRCHICATWQRTGCLPGFQPTQRPTTSRLASHHSQCSQFCNLPNRSFKCLPRSTSLQLLICTSLLVSKVLFTCGRTELHIFSAEHWCVYGAQQPRWSVPARWPFRVCKSARW